MITTALCMSFAGCGEKAEVIKPSQSPVATQAPTKAPTPVPTPTPEPTPVVQRWTEGQYKVGVDIQPGIYMAFTTGSSGYFAVTADSNGDDIIANDNFSNNGIFELKDGQYLELSRAYAVRYEDAPALGPVNGILKEGVYKVGQHIPAGEYKLRAVAGASSAYYCLFSDPNGDKIISNDNFSGERYVTIKDGQFLELSRCELVVPQ